MPNVKEINQILNSHPRLLSIKGSTSFSKTLRKIKKAKNADFVWLEKPKLNQMACVLLTRLIGKKFIWIQNFENPPAPNFLTRLILAQTDKIIVRSKKDFLKLKNSGIDKSKIKYQRQAEPPMVLNPSLQPREEQ